MAQPNRTGSGVMRAMVAGAVSGRYASIAGPPRSEAPRRASFTRKSAGPLRALVIVQDESARSAILRVTQKHGGETLVAVGFSEAICVLDSLDGGRAMVFFDPLQPGFDPRFVQFLRRSPRVGASPVVITSAMSAQALTEIMATSGADGFIVTSKGLLHMDTAIQSWLERHDATMAGP
jgi:hypothetical protein